MRNKLIAALMLAGTFYMLATLAIKTERTETKDRNGRSEFSYGSFERTITLPAGADEDDITASYDKGILSVSVGIGSSEPQAKRITVESAG